MISTTSFYKGITVIQVLVIILSDVTCDNKPIDYDLPSVEESHDYIGYHFRRYTRYNQSKLDPEKFFKSAYNRSFRVLPYPSAHDYESYKRYFIESEKSINVQEIKETASYYEPEEGSVDEDDKRYIKSDPELYSSTDDMYNQSNIYLKEYELAKGYYDTMNKTANNEIIPQPLSSDEFLEIMAFYELMPKSYEDGDDFIKARIELGRLIGQSFIDLKIKGANAVSVKLNDNEYDTELVKLSLKDAHLKNEDYGQYALRMVYLGKIPLHFEVCNELYKTSHTNNKSFEFTNLKFNLTQSNSLEKSSKT